MRVFADQADRHIRGDDLPGRVGRREFALQPGQLDRSEDAGVVAVVAPVPGRIAIAAHVEQKDVEQRPVADLAIDPAGLRRRAANRHEFMKRAGRPRHQQRAAVLGVAGLVGGADRRPVIGDFMVVPLRQHRHLRIEGAQILVEQVVFVVAAKLREGLGDDGFFLRDDIAPEAAVRQFQFGLDRAVGIDVIAAMNEEVRAVFQHGGVGSHAAAGGIDAPALAGGIARPDERYRLPLQRARCGNARPALLPKSRARRYPQTAPGRKYPARAAGPPAGASR